MKHDEGHALRSAARARRREAGWPVRVFQPAIGAAAAAGLLGTLAARPFHKTER